MPPNDVVTVCLDILLVCFMTRSFLPVLDNEYMYATTGDRRTPQQLKLLEGDLSKSERGEALWEPEGFLLRISPLCVEKEGLIPLIL